MDEFASPLAICIPPKPAPTITILYKTNLARKKYGFHKHILTLDIIKVE